MELTGTDGETFGINDAFVRHYGDRFTIEGLMWVSTLNATQLLELIHFIIEADEGVNLRE